MINTREIFDNYYSMIDREGKEELLQYLEINGYFTAPASSKYHLCKEGGLLEHSINVVNLMMDINGLLNAAYTESIVIVGLFHDLGKANYYGKPNYKDNILKNGKRSDAKPYEKNKDMLNIPHEVSSIHILSQYIELTEEETFAILYHNGLYTPVGYGLKGNETSLSMIAHFADLYASRIIER